MGKIIDHTLEIAAVTLFSPFVLLSADVAVFGYLVFYKFYILITLYVIWCLVSRNYDSQGGRRIECLKKFFIWKYYANYFPINLIKTAEISPNRNYLCGYHPHGYFATGMLINFVTDATGFSLKFPNLRSWILTHSGGFRIPFHRDFILALGGRSASRESIKWLLTKEGVGNFVVLIPGGIQEMNDTEQRKFKLKLNSRKGFIRLAIETGASLVPILSFGENDIYHIPDGKTWLGRKLAQLRERIKSLPPIYYGTLCLPFLPFRVSLKTVVGKPIDVKQNVEPTDDEICSLHKIYIEQLRQLYDEYKDQCGNANVQLEMY